MHISPPPGALTGQSLGRASGLCDRVPFVHSPPQAPHALTVLLDSVIDQPSHPLVSLWRGCLSRHPGQGWANQAPGLCLCVRKRVPPASLPPSPLHPPAGQCAPIPALTVSSTHRGVQFCSVLHREAALCALSKPLDIILGTWALQPLAREACVLESSPIRSLLAPQSYPPPPGCAGKHRPLPSGSGRRSALLRRITSVHLQTRGAQEYTLYLKYTTSKTKLFLVSVVWFLSKLPQNSRLLLPPDAPHFALTPGQ